MAEQGRTGYEVVTNEVDGRSLSVQPGTVPGAAAGAAGAPSAAPAKVCPREWALGGEMRAVTAGEQGKPADVTAEVFETVRRWLAMKLGR